MEDFMAANQIDGGPYLANYPDVMQKFVITSYRANTKLRSLRRNLLKMGSCPMTIQSGTGSNRFISSDNSFLPDSSLPNTSPRLLSTLLSFSSPCPKSLAADVPPRVLLTAGGSERNRRSAISHQQGICLQSVYSTDALKLSVLS